MPASLPFVQQFLACVRGTLRGRNALFHVFELWVGLAGIIAGIAFFWTPASISQDPVALAEGRAFAAIWTIGYMIAGALIWWGLLRPSPKFETMGLWLLGSATSTSAVAIIGIFGSHGIAGASLLVALTAAAWARAIIVQSDALRLTTETRDAG